MRKDYYPPSAKNSYPYGSIRMARSVREECQTCKKADIDPFLSRGPIQCHSRIVRAIPIDNAKVKLSIRGRLCTLSFQACCYLLDIKDSALIGGFRPILYHWDSSTFIHDGFILDGTGHCSRATGRINGSDWTYTIRIKLQIL